jgi:hypothetical protein
MGKTDKKEVSVSFKLPADKPEDLGSRLNAYQLKVANAQHKIPFGLKITIYQMALEKWLDENENNPNIDFSRPTGNRKS